MDRFRTQRGYLRRIPFGAVEGRHYECVHGEEGIGKSELAQQMLADAESTRLTAPVELPFDDFVTGGFLDHMGRLRERISKVAPRLVCPRFDAGYTFAVARTRPQQFRAGRWRVAPAHAREVFEKSLEDATSETLVDLLKQLAAPAAATAANAATLAVTAGMVAGAMAAAIAGTGAAGATVAVLLARHYLIGLPRRARENALLRECPNLKRLVEAGTSLKLPEMRRILPLLLAEDLNHALNDQPDERRRLITLFLDPVDPLLDDDALMAQQLGEAFQRLMGDLRQAYVLAFGRSPPLDWERRFESVSGHGPLHSHYSTRHLPLMGLSETSVTALLHANAATLGLTAAQVAPAVAALPRTQDGVTISPATLQTYWTSRVP